METTSNRYLVSVVKSLFQLWFETFQVTTRPSYELMSLMAHSCAPLAARSLQNSLLTAIMYRAKSVSVVTRNHT